MDLERRRAQRAGGAAAPPRARGWGAPGAGATSRGAAGFPSGAQRAQRVAPFAPWGRLGALQMETSPS